MSAFGFKDSKIMSIDEVVKELKNALNDYATATQTGDLDTAKPLRTKIRNIIRSYQPENEEEGIFDDIISLLPEPTFDQFIAIQKNILNDKDTPIRINTKDITLIDKLAKDFLFKKAGFKLIYENTQKNLDKMAGSFIDKVAYVTSKIPELPSHEIDDETLRNLVDKSTQNISAASSGIAADCKTAIDTNVKSFFSFIDMIKNTVDQLLNLKPTEYEHDIWGDRSKYVKKDGTLVDPVEQIRLNMIIEELKKSCGKLPSTPVYTVKKIEEKKYAHTPKIKRSASAPSAIVFQKEYDGSDTEIDSQGTKLYSQESPPPYFSDDDDYERVLGKKHGREDEDYERPSKKRGGKTKKNKRKSKNVKRKSKKVKRKSGRKTNKNKRNRRNKRKTRVKK